MERIDNTKIVTNMENIENIHTTTTTTTTPQLLSLSSDLLLEILLYCKTQEIYTWCCISRMFDGVIRGGSDRRKRENDSDAMGVNNNSLSILVSSYLNIPNLQTLHFYVSFFKFIYLKHVSISVKLVRFLKRLNYIQTLKSITIAYDDHCELRESMELLPNYIPYYITKLNFMFDGDSACSIPCDSFKFKLLPNLISFSCSCLTPDFYGLLSQDIYFNNLIDLNISYISLIKLNNLPSNLRILNCSFCKLFELILPYSVRELYCSNNVFEYLNLPPNLEILDCHMNELKELKLPRGLSKLIANDNRLTYLEIPPLCNYIDVSNNKIKYILNLPLHLYHLNLKFNPIFMLRLPESCLYLNTLKTNLERKLQIESTNRDRIHKLFHRNKPSLIV